MGGKPCFIEENLRCISAYITLCTPRQLVLCTSTVHVHPQDVVFLDGTQLRNLLDRFVDLTVSSRSAKSTRILVVISLGGLQRGEFLPQGGEIERLGEENLGPQLPGPAAAVGVAVDCDHHRERRHSVD